MDDQAAVILIMLAFARTARSSQAPTFGAGSAVKSRSPAVSVRLEAAWAEPATSSTAATVSQAVWRAHRERPRTSLLTKRCLHRLCLIPSSPPISYRQRRGFHRHFVTLPRL
jgi:hypothetical protein